MRQTIIYLIIFALIATAVMGISINRDVFNGYHIKSITGDEQYMYDININGTQICLIPKFLDTKVIKDCVPDITGTSQICNDKTLKIPSKLILLKGKDVKQLDKKDDKFCYDEGVEDYLKFGENSIVIVGDSSYASTEQGIRQERNVIHLNVSDNNLVLYMPFEQDNKSIISDWSSYNNDGTGYEGTNITAENGYIGRGMNFNNKSYISMPYSQSYNFSGKNFTICEWIKPKDGNVSIVKGIVYFGSDSSQNKGTSIILKFVTGVVSFVIYHNGTSLNNTALIQKNIPINTWSYLCAIFNGTHIATFKNGVNDYSVSVSGGKRYSLKSNSSCKLWIGRSYGNVINASMDEIMIFNKSLNHADILKLYNRQYPLFMSQGNITFLNKPVSNANTVSVQYTGTSPTGTYINSRIGYWKTSYGYTAPPVNLVLWLRGDNNTIDSSLYGNNGAWLKTSRYNGGVYNKSMVFNKTFIKFTYDQRYNFSRKNFTVCAWNYINGNMTASTSQVIVSKGNYGSSRYSFALEFKAAYGYFKFDIWHNNSITNTTASLSLRHNYKNWYYVCGRWNGTHTALFVNGVQEDSDIVSVSRKYKVFDKLTGIVNVGSYFDTGDMLNGSVDDVMIFNYSLDSSEIRNFYLGKMLNWKYTAYGNGSHFIDVQATNILPAIQFYSDSYGFYSPYITSNFTIINRSCYDPYGSQLNFSLNICTNLNPINYSGTSTYMQLSNIFVSGRYVNMSGLPPFNQIFNGTSSTPTAVNVNKWNQSIPAKNRTIILSLTSLSYPKLLSLDTRATVTSFSHSQYSLDISCTGNGGFTVTNLDSILKAYNYVLHTKNGVASDYIQTNNFTVTSCSNHSFSGLDDVPLSQASPISQMILRSILATLLAVAIIAMLSMPFINGNYLEWDLKKWMAYLIFGLIGTILLVQLIIQVFASSA